MSELTEREVAIFNAARPLAGSERAAYLDKACAGDAALRQRLDELLRVDEPAGDFLEKPAYADAGDAAIPGGTVPLSATLSEKPGDRIGRYKLLQQIGEGGCGVVYMAEQEEPVHRRVALKVIKLGMDTRSVVARFEAERQALALMDHPNIAKVLDAGATETGRPYFVMELIKAIPITRYCDENNLSTVKRVGLFVQVCQAVQHAHQKGIIHRDIKPSNILVADHDGVAVPKIIDFGIAKATTDQRLTDKTVFTAFEQFIGTPAYMSPEQAKLSGLDVDTRTDIYSLGVLLYELLTGKTPFEAKRLLEAGLDEIRRIIREEEPVRPSTRLQTLDAAEQTTVAKLRQSDPPKLLHLVRGDLDWIVMKCLEKDRSRRYVTVNGLTVDIQRHLENEPVIARPPSAVYRIQKAWLRNKLLFSAAAALAATMLVGITVSRWEAIQARKARNAEKEQRLGAQAAQRAETQQRQRAEQREAEVSRLLYVANMRVAQQAWEQNNIGLLRQALADTQDSPYRGFEWYFWQPQTHLAFKTLRGHLDAVSSVAFSRNGQRIVTGSWDNTAKVWETASGLDLLTLKGHRYPIYCAAFSPDGLRIVTGSGDNTAKVWDAASGKELATLKGHRNIVRSVVFSPDGQRIVTGSWDNTAKVWETATGRELFTIEGHSARVNSAAFSPDGLRILTGSFDRTARVWEAATGRGLLTLEGHSDSVRSVAFSPDGQRIVTGSWDTTAMVWAADTGRILHTLKGHGAGILSVGFSLNGERIVTGSDDNTAKVWDAASGKELVTLKGHSSVVNSAAFSPDGLRIVTGSGDNTAKLWDVASGVSGYETSPDLITLKGHRAEIWSVAFSPDGLRIVTGSRDHTAKVWEAASGRELFTLNGHSGVVYSVAFSPDGQRIVTTSQDATAIVWEAATGLRLQTLTGHGGAIASAAFSPDGLRIVTGSEDTLAKVWETATGRELFTLQGHGGMVNSVAVSTDGLWIVTGSDDRTAKIWEAASGRFARTLEGDGQQINSVAFSPDGQRIVTGNYDNTAQVWEAASAKPLFKLKGHSNNIMSVGFSPDGQRIVTGSWDRTARVWEAATGRELLALRHYGGIVSASFSRDGRRIVTGSLQDHAARVWEAARPEQVAAWQMDERAAAHSLAALQLERTAEQERQRSARVRDSIKQWLILAPIALATGQSGAEGLDIEQIQGEGRLRPKAGEVRSLGGGELKWREVVLKDYVIDFNAILAQVTTQSVAYAVCYIRSQAEQHGLQMLVGSSDEAKAYLNGQQVYRAPVPHGIVELEEQGHDVVLNAGLNVLVFKVVNETDNWKGSIRFTDAQGDPVKGIEVTLDPAAKD